MNKHNILSITVLLCLGLNIQGSAAECQSSFDQATSPGLSVTGGTLKAAPGVSKQSLVLEGPVSEEHDIPRPISQIWDPSVPLPSSTEAPLLSGVTFHIIKPYEPDVDGYKWLHGATIVRHKGTWFMTWGHNKGRENSVTEIAQGRRSTDDFATLTPVEMIAPGTPTDAHSHGVTLSLNGNLWGFLGLSKGGRKGNRAEAFKLNETTDQWESQGVVMDKGFWPYTEPKRMDNGNYITAGFRMNVENGSPPAVAISNGEDMTDWTVVSIPKPAELNGMWGESAVIIRGKHLLCIARNSKGKDENWAYVSVSNDYGLTWTPVERSNMPMAASKPYAGTLSNGRDYLIATTTADAGKTRRPLTIALTDPGGGQFNRIYRIRDGIRPGETSTIAAALAYPYAVEHDGSLYVVYSVGRPGTHNHNSLELAIIPLSSLASLQASTFHISPDGKDSNDGSKDAPFGTFEKTLEAVAALPRPWKSDVIVEVMPGNYHLKSTLLLTGKHSGDGEHRLIFKNQGALARAKLIGGQKIDPKAWKFHQDGVLYQDIPGVERIDILYENGRKGRKARTPNFEHLKDFPVTDGKYFISGTVGKGQPWITAQSKDLDAAQLNSLNDEIKGGADAYLVIWGHGSGDWHKWIHPITHTEPESGRIHVSEKKPIFHKGRKDKGCRYYIEGGLHHLDAEREFYFDRNKKRLYYKPHGPDPGEVIYATMNNLIKLDGARNITFDGLMLAYSGVLPHTDSSYTWTDPEAALTVHHSQAIEIRNCRFKSTGQSAINFEQTHASTIENCLMQHLGQSGIKLYESDSNTIRNCLIHDIGLRRVYAEGLAVHASAHNSVSHLEIHNSARYGITVRGKVGADGRDRHPTRGNRFSHIRIADVNQDSGDTAGLHMAKINAVKGPDFVNHFEQITITRSIAQPNITDEWAPTGVYLDHKQSVMNQSMRNIEVTDYDPRYKGYTVKRFGGIYGKEDRTSAKQRQIMQNRPWNNDSSTKFNGSWQEDFDPVHMEYDKIGLTEGFPKPYERFSNGCK